MNKSFTVYTGESPLIKAAARRLIEEAGVTQIVSGSVVAVGYVAFRVENGDFASNLYTEADATHYQHGTHGCPHFDAATQLGALAKFLSGPDLLMVGEWAVTFPGNGDVKVGCTLVPSALFEKIAKERVGCQWVPAAAIRKVANALSS